MSRAIFFKANKVLKNFHPERTDRKLLVAELPLKGGVSPVRNAVVNGQGIWLLKRGYSITSATPKDVNLTEVQTRCMRGL